MDEPAQSAAEPAAEWRSEGLYDPEAPNAADRLALLEYLHERGATLQALLDADRLGNLPGLAGELVRWGGHRRITAREASERSGVPLDALVRMARAAGFVHFEVDEPIYLESDVEAFKAFDAGRQFFGEDSSLQFTRVLGAAMASVADAATSEFGRDVQPRLVEAGASELERAQTVERASRLLIDQVPIAMQTLFFHHVEAAVRRMQISGSEVIAYLAVGFVDLVGSTAMGEQLDARDLGAALSAFEQAATETISTHGGRLVKTIGDEVMYVHEHPNAACVIALELQDTVAKHPALPMLRGGIAVGGLVRGYGDYYGPVVNAAARIVKLAEPGSILVTDAVHAGAGSAADGLRFEPAGHHELLGITDPVTLYVLVRA